MESAGQGALSRGRELDACRRLTTRWIPTAEIVRVAYEPMVDDRGEAEVELRQEA